MQQYRINYTLLIGLIVGTLVTSAAVYGLWSYQIDRNADELIVAAEKSVEEGDLKAAARQYGYYVSIRPKETDVRIKLANVWADIAESGEAQREDIGVALNVMETTARNYPDESELRQRLVDFYVRNNAFQEALDHVGLMLAADPDNTDLKLQRATLLVRARKYDEALDEFYPLVGFDPEADRFNAEAALTPHEVDAYSTMASLERAQNDNEELADRVMDQMIEVNPDSAEAYLRRGTYYIGANEPEKGQRNLDKAYEMDPHNADVLSTCGAQAVRNENYDRARELFETGKKEFPEDPRFYLALADLEMQQGNSEAGIAIMDEGLDAVPKTESSYLLLRKAELLLRTRDSEAVSDAIDDMRAKGFSPQYIQYMEAQKLLTEGKWYEALKALRDVQTKFKGFNQLDVQISFQIGLCNEKLGRPEKALEAYNLVLQQHPLNEPASLGRQRVRLEMQRPNVDSKGQQMQSLINTELAKSESERDWTLVDAAARQIAEERELEGAPLDLFWARMKLARRDFKSAQKHLRDADRKDKDNLQVHRLAVQALRFDPDHGPREAMRLLDRVESKFGDQPQLRLDRADLILSSDMDLETKRSQIVELAENTGEWSDDDVTALLDGLAPRCGALGMRDKATEYWTRVADLRPNDLPTRVQLFSLAAEENDDAGMQAAQNRILNVVKNENDSTWLFTEARRLLSLYRRDQLDESALDRVRRLIDRAFDARPDWFELHLVNAELELIRGNEEAALESLERAEQLGQANPRAILQHVRLLLKRGQYAPAKALVEQLPERLREGRLAQVYAEILLNTGEVEEATEVAKSFVELDPDNAARQSWYGRLLLRGASGASPDLQEDLVSNADQALQKAAELNPTSADSWLPLVSLNVLRGNREGAQEALRQAQLNLPEDRLVGVMAKGQEIMGRWFDAENIYTTLREADPDNLAIARQLAEFYLGPYYQRPDKGDKAVPLINQILRAAVDGELEDDDPNVMWARRTGAKLLASTGQYQKLRKAENLLRSNAPDGKLSIEDQLRMAEILAPRSEPESRLKAKNLLENVAQQQQLNLQGELMLGQLYFALGDWRDCRRQMFATISKYPDSAEARMAYIRMILQHGDSRYYDDAEDQLEKLLQIASTNAQTIELMVRVAARTGKEQVARQRLLQLVPKVSDPKEITDEQSRMMEYIATLLIELDDLQNAEKIYRMVVAGNPNKALTLARFLGEHRDVDQSMELIGKVFQPDLRLAQPTLQVAIAVDRARRDEVGDKYDQQILDWINRALLENPDAMPLLMLSAEFDDLRKHYDEAAESYRKLLARKELTGTARAVVLNNLAFLLALAGPDAEPDLNPMKLVQEASEILGPTADILDTRAVVYTSRGEYQKAIDDLELSVTDNPSPAKFYHKAVAHLGLNENTAALEAWEKAEELGDIRNDLNRMEYEQFEEVNRKIDDLRAQRRQLTGTQYRAAG